MLDHTTISDDIFFQLVEDGANQTFNCKWLLSCW